MEEIVAQLQAIFQILKQPPNDESLKQATTSLEQYMNTADSFTSFIYLLESHDPFVRQQSALIIPKMLKKFQFQELCDDLGNLFSHLMRIICSETMSVIQKNISESFGVIDDENIEIINYLLPTIHEWFESNQPGMINAALNILPKVEIDNSQQEYPFFLQIIEKGLMTGDKMPAFNFSYRLGMYLTYNFDEDELKSSQYGQTFATIWEMIIDHIITNIEDISLVKELCVLLSNMIEDGYFYSDPVPIYEKLLPLIGNTEINIEIQNSILQVVGLVLLDDDIISIIEENEQIPNILQQFITLSSLAYLESDALPLSYCDVFDDLCDAFKDLESFVTTLYASISTLYQDAITRPSIILLIAHLIEAQFEVNDFFSDPSEFFVPAVEKFVEASTDESLLTRNTAAFAIKIFAEECHDYIDDYLEDLVTAILTSLQQDLNQDMLLALTSIFEQSFDTDPVFQLSYQMLFPVLSSSGHLAKQLIFPCFAELCRNSKSLVRQYFDEVYPLMIQILQSSDPEVVILVENAIGCLSALSVSCRDQFMEHALEIAQFYSNFILSEDESTQICILRAFGVIVQNQGDIIQPIFPQLIPNLIEIASRDLNIVFGQELKNMHENMTNFEGEYVLDDEEQDDNDKLSPYAIPALSLSLICSMAFTCTELLDQNLISQIQNCIMIQTNSINQDCLDMACKATVQFIESLSKIESPSMEIANELLERVSNLITSATGIETLAECFTILGSLISTFKIPFVEANFTEIDKILEAFFDGKLKSLSLKEYDENFHPIFMNFMSELIDILGEKAPELLEKYFNRLLLLKSDKKAQIREFSLFILGFFVECGSQNISEDILNDILLFSINAVRAQNSPKAVYVINQYTSSCPNILRPYVQDILDLFLNKLTTRNRKAINNVSLIDNIVATLGEMQRNIVGNDFPLQEFLIPCLKQMPAKEESDINLDMYLFYLWMARTTQMQPADEFASAALRLFVKPYDEVGHINSDPAYGQVANVLRQLSQSTPGFEELCQNVCAGDQYKLARIYQVLNVEQ